MEEMEQCLIGKPYTGYSSLTEFDPILFVCTVETQALPCMCFMSPANLST